MQLAFGVYVCKRERVKESESRFTESVKTDERNDTVIIVIQSSLHLISQMDENLHSRNVDGALLCSLSVSLLWSGNLVRHVVRDC